MTIHGASLAGEMKRYTEFKYQGPLKNEGLRDINPANASLTPETKDLIRLETQLTPEYHEFVHGIVLRGLNKQSLRKDLRMQRSTNPNQVVMGLRMFNKLEALLRQYAPSDGDFEKKFYKHLRKFNAGMKADHETHQTRLMIDFRVHRALANVVCKDHSKLVAFSQQFFSRKKVLRAFSSVNLSPKDFDLAYVNIGGTVLIPVRVTRVRCDPRAPSVKVTAIRLQMELRRPNKAALFAAITNKAMGQYEFRPYYVYYHGHRHWTHGMQLPIADLVTEIPKNWRLVAEGEGAGSWVSPANPHWASSRAYD
jgi:hypothetical protein